MKKSSGLKNVGGDTGKLIVYSEPDFQGEEHTFLGLYMVLGKIIDIQAFLDFRGFNFCNF